MTEQLRSGATTANTRPLGGILCRARARAGDTIWALLEQGIALVASLLSFLLLGRTLGAAGYGAFIGIYALMGPFAAPGQAGVYLAAMEHIVRLGEDRVDVARSCLTITAVSALFWVPLVSVASIHWIEDLPAIAAILFVGTEFFLNGFNATCLGIVQALAGFPPIARLRMLQAASKIGLLVALAAAHSLTLTSLAIGQAFTLGAVLLYVWWRVSRLLGVWPRPGRTRGRHVRSTLLYGVALAASSAQSDGDKFLLNAAHHQADAGRYGAAYRLMGIVLLPMSALLSATHLSFLNADQSASTHLRRAVRLSLVTMAYAVPAVICLILLAPFVPRVLTKDFAETTFILQLLAPVVILRGSAGFPMNGLMGLGRNALRTKLLVGNMLLSLILYAALIPKHSWKGALVGTLVSEFSLCASAWVALVLCERRRRNGRNASESGRKDSVSASLQRAASAESPVLNCPESVTVDTHHAR